MLQIEWLKQILPVVRKSVSTTQSKFSPDFTQAAWDAFIVKYARRALEFPVVFVRQEEPSKYLKFVILSGKTAI